MRAIAEYPEIPVEANQYLKLRWVVDTLPNGNVTLKYWIGRAKKPKGYYRYGDMRYLEDELTRLKKTQDENAKWEQEKKQRQLELLDRVQEGTILHYSWGWEQTNCEFYQVISRNKSTIEIREIESKEVGDRHFQAMSCQLCPVPGKFVENAPILKKRITKNGIKMDHGYAYVTSPEKSHYSSWYA